MPQQAVKPGDRRLKTVHDSGHVIPYSLSDHEAFERVGRVGLEPTTEGL